MKISPNLVIQNLKAGSLDQLKGQKNMWISISPYLAGCVALKILSEAVVKYPAEQVIPFAATALNYSIYPLIVLTAYKLWKALENENPTVQGRKIQYVQMPKEEFEKLKTELLLFREAEKFRQQQH